MNDKHISIQNTRENLDFESNWMEAKFSHPERVIRLGTSFSGIGAIEHAFKRLGLKCQIKFAGDIDEDCKTAYLKNYDFDESNWHSDIHEFDATPFLHEIDLFVGGAPCQAFSLRGKHGGFEDTRGTLFREFARVVMECQPKVFIFENVKGILSHDKGNTWKVIKDTFEKDCGYQVYYQVLNGKDYGIPQSRDRVYCIGFKEPRDFKYPSPIPLEHSMPEYLQKSFSQKYLLKQKGVSFITESVNHKKSYTQINGDIQLCQKRNQQFNWHGDFVFYPALKTDEPNEYLFDTSNLEESYYVDSQKELSLKFVGQNCVAVESIPSEIDYSKGYFRKLTPRECLSLMGFNESFEIVVSDTATYKQSGNSIIVDVLMSILKQMDITKYGVNY